MNALSAFIVEKCVERPDTICSTRPLNCPVSILLAAYSCTTKARLVGNKGCSHVVRIVLVSLCSFCLWACLPFVKVIQKSVVSRYTAKVRKRLRMVRNG